MLAFAQKGASKQMIRVLASFLRNRVMTVRVNQVWSEPRKVNTGAPQGSVLGSFLFNVGIDDIEQGCVYPDEPFQDTLESQPSKQDYPASSTPRRVGVAHSAAAESPIRLNEQTEQELRILTTAVNTLPWLRRPKEQKWQERAPVDLKFIDHGVNVSSVNMKKVALYNDLNGKPIKVVHPSKPRPFYTT